MDQNTPLTLLKLMRPKQWTKNIFVFTGLIFSGALSNFPILLSTCIAAIAFCLASSTIYIFNDIIDRESDLHHPQKKHRPIPSGEVTSKAAYLLTITSGILSLLIATTISYMLLLIIISYIVLNILYTLRLKHYVIIDVFCISAGFMLRILAGTKGVDIPPSKWLLLCGFMITLFLGFAKRRAELTALTKTDLENTRQVLRDYSKGFLDAILSICVTCVIIGFSLYTMSETTIRIHQTDDLILTLPFVIYALFRYMYILFSDKSTGDPSIDILRDKHIALSILGWVVSSVYFIGIRGM